MTQLFVYFQIIILYRSVSKPDITKNVIFFTSLTKRGFIFRNWEIFLSVFISLPIYSPSNRHSFDFESVQLKYHQEQKIQHAV